MLQEAIDNIGGHQKIIRTQIQITSDTWYVER